MSLLFKILVSCKNYHYRCKNFLKNINSLYADFYIESYLEIVMLTFHGNNISFIISHFLCVKYFDKFLFLFEQKSPHHNYHNFPQYLAYYYHYIYIIHLLVSILNPIDSLLSHIFICI